VKLVVGPVRHLPAAFDLSGPADLLILQSPDALPADLGDPRIARRLTLRFNDIAEPRAGLTPPDAALVAELLAFGAQAPVLVVHCFAGVSRSTAAAYAIACQAAGPGQEAALARALRELSAAATPNPLVVALAEAALGRGGRMVEAIAAVGRGVEAFEGPLFAWPVAPATIAGD
jgi:predicted protein tyrosine phosphatase